MDKEIPIPTFKSKMYIIPHYFGENIHEVSPIVTYSMACPAKEFYIIIKRTIHPDLEGNVLCEYIASRWLPTYLRDNISDVHSEPCIVRPVSVIED